MEKTIPKLVRETALAYPEIPAQRSKDKDGNFIPVTYQEMFNIALDFGAGLLSFGVERGEHIGLISDNRKEWLQADVGLLSIGAIDVPRGNDATENDLRFILATAECKIVLADNNTQVKKILSLKGDLPLLSQIICFDELDEASLKSAEEKGVKVSCFSQIVQAGKTYRAENPGKVEEELEKGDENDLATLIFTSGTTGEPKGVMLTHKNFISQLYEVNERIYVNPGDDIICVLPVWHVFQRACEYVVLSQAGSLGYSKPVGSVLLKDLAALNPCYLPAVPRVYEALYDGINRAMRKTGGIVFYLFRFFTTVSKAQCYLSRLIFQRTAKIKKQPVALYWVFLSIPCLLLTPLKMLGSKLVFSKVRAKMGTKFRAGVSGGGALPPSIDEFFWAAGVKIVEGYGLTETSPIIAVRPVDNPTFGTVGSPIRNLELRIVDENGNDVPQGQKGVVIVRGPTVMQGYYKKPELTAKAIDKDGWFNTGDIGLLTLDNQLILRGRMKDTIVLRGGENVEPLPIEMKMCESRYISQTIVVGQDEKMLTALIIPSKDELIVYARENYVAYDQYSDLLTKKEIIKLIESEVQSLVSGKNGFKTFERISKFTLLEKPFEVGVELSAKQEIMRYKITEIYEKQIKAMYVE